MPDIATHATGPQFAIHLLVGPSRLAAGMAATALLTWVLYITLARLPYTGHGHQVFRSAAEGALLWMAATSTAQAAGQDAKAGLWGASVAAVASGAGAYLLARRANRVTSLFYTLRSKLGQSGERVYRFIDDEEPLVSLGVEDTL